MHMSDALVSAPIALGADAIAATLLAISIRKIYRQERLSIPLMGVLGAFVFAAQMINFAIPGTGSSGHIIGGILLSSMLGAWGGFFTLCSVIVLQCLLFADGGLLALGCNALNMAAFSCLVAYPLIFKPLYRADCSTLKLFSASILANIAAFLMGAIAVTLETTLSGVSALPLGRMLLFMLPIHFVIGICEGVATALVILFVRRRDPELFLHDQRQTSPRRTIEAFAIAAFIIAASFTLVASSAPDGLEWSIENVLQGELPSPTSELHTSAELILQKTAIIPDYNTFLAGIIGCAILIFATWLISLLSKRVRRNESQS